MLTQRIDSLTEAGRTLLRAASVLGRKFDPSLAGGLVGLDGEDLIAAGEDILLSGLVVETSSTTVAFSHALVQAAVETQLSALRRIDLHRRVALALESIVGGGSARVADLARHWAAVAQVDPSAVGSAADGPSAPETRLLLRRPQTRPSSVTSKPASSGPPQPRSTPTR